MRRSCRATFSTLVLVFSISGNAQVPVEVDDYQSGVDAFAAGEYELAADIWLMEAYEGSSDAQFNLGVIFLEGKGVPQDRNEAIFWFTRAAEAGHMEAQYNLGYLFFENKDDPELMRKGLDWWRRSAVQGFSIAQFNYGGALFYGIGEEKNLSAAKFWIEQSARSGEQVAINFLEKNAADFAHLKQSKTYIKNSEQPAETPENSFEAGDAAVAGQQENSASDQGATAIVEEPPAAEKQQEKAQEQKKVELTIDEFVSQLAGGTATGSGNENSARVESSNDQKIHRVNNSGIQLLDSPELNAEPMFKVSRGTLVAVNSVEKDWARASIPGGLPVWLPASAISIENNIAVVDKNRVEMSLLPEAGSHKAALGELGKGVRLEILDVDDQWVRVLAPQQVSGWVLLSDLDPETGSDELNREWRKQQRKLHNLFDKY